jgi:leader peptidase (prepilin peptidase)/N-methyltransferase
VTGVAIAVSALLGLLIGSFLNVVIWRVPRGESVASPPSACPRCGHRIRARDNVPVLSWLLLRGRCRDCAAPISARYPLVEAGTALLFGLVGLRFGFSAATPAFLYLADLDTHRLPNAIVLPAYPVAAVLLILAAWGSSGIGALGRAAIAGAALFGFYFVMMVVYPSGMGFGDVKLAGALGLYLGWVGWGALLVGAFAAFLLGGAVSIVLLLTGRATRKTGIPFGPFMLLGAGVGIAVGEPAWSAYLTLLG